MGILIPPGAEPIYITPATGPAFTLAELQGFVGGYIEVVRLSWLVSAGFDRSQTEPLLMIVNEDGKRLDMPRNGFATALAKGAIDPTDVIVGPVVVCTLTEAGGAE